MLDILIKNGHVVDPTRNINGLCTIGVTGDKIVEIISENTAEARKVVDASGCFVFPGLIDFHGHFNFEGSSIGANPSLMAASGVTSVVDAGSCGCLNFPLFYKSVIINSQVRVKAFLSCYSMGLGGGKIHENFDERLFDKELIIRVMSSFPNVVLGLKIRCSIPLIKDLAPLKRLVEIAEEIGPFPICVHTTNPPESIVHIADILRKGDIFCHVYHGTGDVILNEKKEIKEKILEARERGVIFDVAHGNNHFSNEICLKALEQGFYPDIISTDMTNDKLYSSTKARSLPFVMSKFLSMGMPLYDIVRCVTETPSKLMGMSGIIGTLSPGANADIAIMGLVEKEFPSMDAKGSLYTGNRMLLPQMTLINGEIVYSQEDFNLIQ
ncbi:amidohydrolase family protein [Aminivibrio sp.]|jgi:dihydroorotase|uniref:amidohydrolase family protein n=1 Tax=Aminivibrio sp. TaxID=1872489 RepID=UPI003D979B35